ncbi:MAG: ABC transporter ATP-binding protein [Candidatus Deferrimicrobiaceae bacterium]
MPAIRVENLSKEYVIGGAETGRDNLREALAEALLAPFRRFRRLAGNVTQEERFLALDDVSFEVQAGETLGIIGRNGAGKSTLLKILSRITLPTSGRAELKGRVSSLLEVGTGFHPELTGRENIFLNGTILGMTRSEIRRRFDEIVAFSEIEKFLDTPVKRYSSGMYVRLAFAVAAHLDPEILIVDEVLAVGDAQFQKKCLGKMEEAGREGRTILFISHNLTAIRKLCTRVILLSRGELAADGAPKAVIAEYTGETEGVTLSRVWSESGTALGNSFAVLEAVSVCDDEGNPLDELFTDRSFNVEIRFRVIRDGAAVGMNLLFYDMENHCILASINNHEPNWYGKPMREGAYRSVCRIPKNILNNGFFSLSVILFGKNFADSAAEHGVLKLEIRDGPEVRGDYFGEYACCIRPSFDWITVRYEEPYGPR